MASIKILNPEYVAYVEDKVNELIADNYIEIVDNLVWLNGYDIHQYILDSFETDKLLSILDYYGMDKTTNYPDVKSLIKDILDFTRNEIR